MSDFLSNLVERSLGKAEIIRPRLASMFEPAFASSIRSVQIPRLEEAEENISLEKSEPQVIKRPQIKPIEAIASPRASVSTQSDEKPQSDSKRPSPVVSNAASSLLSEQTQESEASHRDEPAARVVPKSQARNEKVWQEHTSHKSPESVSDYSTIKARAVAGDETEAKPAAIARVKQSINHDVTEKREPLINSQIIQPAVEPVVEREIIERIIERTEPAAQSAMPVEPVASEVEHKEFASSIIAQPRVSPYAKTEPHAFHETEPASQSKQIVNVTIGRIEVRAVMSRDMKKESGSEQSPVMSLDEYLRQRQR